MKMGLFMFAEFIEIAIISALFTTLFLAATPAVHERRRLPVPGGIAVALSHARWSSSSC